MEFFLGAFVNPSLSEEIESTKLNSILNEFFASGNLVQVAQKNGDYIKFSEYTDTTDITTIIPYEEIGTTFYGCIVRESVNSPSSNWFFNWLGKVVQAYSGENAFLQEPCEIYGTFYPSILDIEIKELIMGLQFENDPTIIDLQPGTVDSVSSYPVFNFSRLVNGMPSFVEINETSFGFASLGRIMYYQKIGNVYYFCSESFSGSGPLEAVSGSAIGAIDIQLQ